MHLYEYTLQISFYKGTIVYIFQIVILCMLYVQYMAHINGYLHIHILLYSVLFYYTVHVSGVK